MSWLPSDIHCTRHYHEKFDLCTKKYSTKQVKNTVAFPNTPFLLAHKQSYERKQHVNTNLFLLPNFTVWSALGQGYFFFFNMGFQSFYNYNCYLVINLLGVHLRWPYLPQIFQALKPLLYCILEI